jgi:hypothetical protein
MAKQHLPDTSEGSAPGFPNWLDKVNFIIETMLDPCDAPMTVYVTTLWPGAIDMFVSYYEVDFSNILVNLYRWRYIVPRTRTTRKGRKGRKNNKKGWRRVLQRFVDFDQDDWISRKIERFSRLPKRQASTTFAKLLIVEGVVERVNFWFFMVGLVTDFLYSWSSLLRKSIYCQAQGDNVLLADGPDQTRIGITGWHGLNLSNVRKQRGKVSWNYSSGTFDGPTGVVIVTANIEPNGSTNPETIAGMRITVRRLGHSAKTTTSIINVPSHGSAELTCQTPLTAGSRVSIEAMANYGAADFKTPVVLMMGKDKKTEGDG